MLSMFKSVGPLQFQVFGLDAQVGYQLFSHVQDVFSRNQIWEKSQNIEKNRFTNPTCAPNFFCLRAHAPVNIGHLN